MLRTLSVLTGLLCLVCTYSAPAHANGGFYLQAKTRTGCLRPGVWHILNRLRSQVGPVEITSGCDGRHARHSLHYSGRAADIRALAVPQSVAIAALRRMPGVGGIGIYGRGLIHVDIGGPIEWVHRSATRRYAGHTRHRYRYARAHNRPRMHVAHLSRVAFRR